MAQRRILIIDGHPDPDPDHFVHALALAYAEGAAAHDIRMLRLADLDIPVLRSPRAWTEQAPPQAVRDAQEAIAWAEHIAVFYPLWLGDMPALLKAFLEQALRPDFAFRYRTRELPEKLLTGRSARLVVVMGAPSALYTLFYRAHSVKSFERNILKFVGVSPVKRMLVGQAGGSDSQRRRWLDKARALGAAGT